MKILFLSWFLTDCPVIEIIGSVSEMIFSFLTLTFSSSTLSFANIFTTETSPAVFGRVISKLFSVSFVSASSFKVFFHLTGSPNFPPYWIVDSPIVKLFSWIVLFCPIIVKFSVIVWLISEIFCKDSFVELIFSCAVTELFKICELSV